MSVLSGCLRLREKVTLRNRVAQHTGNRRHDRLRQSPGCIFHNSRRHVNNRVRGYYLLLLVFPTWSTIVLSTTPWQRHRRTVRILYGFQRGLTKTEKKHRIKRNDLPAR